MTFLDNKREYTYVILCEYTIHSKGFLNYDILNSVEENAFPAVFCHLVSSDYFFNSQ